MSLKSALFVVGFASVAGVASAQPKEFKPPAPQVAPALDKVAMTAFVCEPSPIPPGTTQVTLKVTIKNVTGGLQGVTLSGLKIRMLRTNPQSQQGDVLELETTVDNLAPGASRTVGAHVNVGPGVRDYFARVDPDDILHEPIVQRANNESRLKLTIPQVSGQQAPPPGSTPPKETQLLDYDKAKRNGAQFAASAEGPTLCSLGQADVNHPGNDTRGVSKPPAGVYFYLDCDNNPGGGRTTPEAFTGFRLKNGWRVKSFDIGLATPANPSYQDYQWRKPPTVGSDDPSLRMHLWANAGGWIRVTVKIEIEGPAGTNPYQ
jgi:hypothetical protein